MMTNLIFFVIFIAHIYSQIHKASFDIYIFLIRWGEGLGPSGPLWLRLCETSRDRLR